MGFGLLFIGYLFMYSFPYNGFDVLPDLIGFIIAFFGVRTLADYGCGWDVLKRYFTIILPSSAVTLLFQVLGLLGVDIGFTVIWDYIYTAFLLVYNILLLVAIYKIADDTDVKSIKAKAQRNLILGIGYYALMLFFNFPISFVQKLREYLSANYSLGLILFIFGYLWLFFNISVIFSCYMWICKEGDEDMPERERKFLKKQEKEEE